MSDTQEAAQGGRRDTRIVEEHHIAGRTAKTRSKPSTTADGAGTRPPAAASPPHRPHGVQLHIVDGAGLAHRDPPARLPVPLGGGDMSTFKTTYDPRPLPAAVERDARALLGQVMGLVAVTVGFAALGAYLGRDLSGGDRAGVLHRRVRLHLRAQRRRRRRPRAARDRAAVRARPAARPRGRARHRRLRQGRPVRPVAGGRSHRGVRRRARRVRLRHAPRPLVLGAHAVLGAARPDRVRDRRDLRRDPRRPTSSTPSPAS